MTWPVLTILVLGIWHGINPGMGWLFAVALGMQERERRSVWRALLPLAAGHALAIASALAVALLIGAVVPVSILKWAIALALVGFGVSRIVRGRHPRYGGMRMSMRKLTVWSFLMASAHGAGFMVLPLVMGMPAAVEAAGGHAHAAAMPMSAWPLAAALGVHTLAYLMVTTLVAWLVYTRVGLAILRTAWFNLDWLWACVLVATGVIVLVV